MATHNYYRDYQGTRNAPVGNGTFWLYSKLDFAKQNCEIDDAVKIFKVKDKWIMLRGFYRCLTASGVSNTIDLGTAEAGTELAATLNANSAGDWAAMSTLAAAAEIALTADGYIWADNNTAAATSGKFEVIIEMYAGPEDGEGTDSLTED